METTVGALDVECETSDRCRYLSCVRELEDEVGVHPFFQVLEETYSLTAYKCAWLNTC